MPGPFVESARGRQDVIAAEAESIEGLAQDIRARLPDVEDKTPWWARLLQSGIWLGIIAGGLALLIYLGVGPLIRSGLAWLGVLIPKPKRSGAKLLSEGKTQEAIAAMREDPQFDAAYRKAKKGTP